MAFVRAHRPATCGDEGSSDAIHKHRTLLEVAVGYGLILIAIWTPLPGQRVVDVGVLAWVVFATARSFDGWRAMGLGLSASLRSFWMVGVALLIAAAVVLLAATLHTFHRLGWLMFVRRYWSYAVWALLQQFLLLDFILLRLLRLLPGKKAAILATAGLFALAHVPNPVLTPLTLLWGWIACLIFLRCRNLYTLAAMHVIFGVCIAITVPGPVDHNMRVGLGYLTYRRQHHHHRSQKDHTVSTAAWVMEEAATRPS